MQQDAQVIKYLNIAREYPSYYVSIIDQQMSTFINDMEMPLTQGVLYSTNQGKKAWKEAKAFLQKQAKLTPFQIHQGLTLSATDHANDLVKHNMFGHNGSDGSSFSERILRHCRKSQGGMAEIIGSDFCMPGRNHAELIVLGLIIDDGIANRGHRNTIFNPSYRYVGCKCVRQQDKMIAVCNITENNLTLKDGSQSKSRSPESHQGFGGLKSNDGWKDRAPPQMSNDWNQPPKVSKSPSHTQSGVSSQHGSGAKKVKQRVENTKTTIEGNAKVTETTVKITYSDGTTEESVERKTQYL